MLVTIIDSLCLNYQSRKTCFIVRCYVARIKCIQVANILQFTKSKLINFHLHNKRSQFLCSFNAKNECILISDDNVATT